MPNSPASLERLFKSNVRMSPSRSRQPNPSLTSRRAALDRAAHALAELNEAKRKFAQLGQEQYNIMKKIEKLSKEYYKLARRAAFLPNANFKTNALSATELAQLRRAAEFVKNMSSAQRTLRRTPLPIHLQNVITRRMPFARG